MAGGAWFDAKPQQLADGLTKLADTYPPGPASEQRALLLAAARQLGRPAYVRREMNWREVIRRTEADVEAGRDSGLILVTMPQDHDRTESGALDLDVKLVVMVPVGEA